ncbi:hypothetical protein VZQ01_14715 [Myxococcus faecalis]|uniref:hypothetical protein n=1 Tax=Myxococcus faecalis TaxID=3115646 RepID=UPI003CF378C8
MRVQLIVTGDMEQRALGESLERLLRAAGAKVEFLPPRKLGDGAVTTNPLPPLTSAQTPRTVQRMAKALVTETLDVSKKNTSLPDLVVGIDDLELANAHQPEVVVGWIRRGVVEEVQSRAKSLSLSSSTVEKIAQELRNRCSFHLLVPLAEAYLFGEPAALQRAGVAAATPVYRTEADLEDFETNDPRFLPRAAVENARKAKHGATWWREEKHPKRYLEFLVELSGGLYDETIGGVHALRTLDWLMTESSSALLFARALFEDIGDTLGMPNPLGAGVCCKWTYPSKASRREELILRNL